MEPSDLNGSFKHPKYMLIKMMGKKIFTNIRSKMFFISYV